MIQKVQKVQNWLKQTAQKIKNWFKVVWQRQRQKKPTTPTEITFRIGWLIFWGLGIIGVGMTLFSPPLGLALLGINCIYFGTCLYEVKAPNVAFLFKRGKFVGRLGPGWYLPIPYFYEVSEIPTDWQQTDLQGDMYTIERTSIVVRARVFYRANENQLKKILRMMPDEMKERSKVIGLAVLRGEVGNRNFKTLVKEKGEIEKKAVDRLEEEFKGYGYLVRDFEIYDFEEKVWSEAEKIKTLGRARGEAAKALAEPLKDNYPAAAVSALGTLAESAEKIAKSIWGEKEKTKSAGTVEKSEGVGEKLTKVVQQIAGKK